jgi:hypothetical protein
MKLLQSLLAGSLALAGGGMIALGGPAVSTLDPKNVVIEDAGKAVMIEDGSAWFVSAGAVVRSIDAGFRLDGHDHISLDWRHYVKRKSGKGDVGLFKGGFGKVQYDDGSVGPGYEFDNFFDGTGYTTINTPGQSRLSGRGFINAADEYVPIYEAVFHTDGYRYGASLHRDTVHVSDSDTGVGPYVKLGRRLIDGPDWILNAVTGWSYVSTDHASGDQALAGLTVRETRTVYTYAYDHDYGEITVFPFVDEPPGLLDDSLLIFDVTGGYGRPENLDPRKHSSSRTRTVARFYAVGSSHLDVDLNEIPLGVEVGRSFGKLELFLTGGATLNVIGYDLDSQVSWFREGHSRALTTERWRDSGTELKIGLYGGLAAKYPLTASGKIYLEAHGSYRWVDPVHASAGFADVEIDPSSWEGGLGIGIVLE